jgi:hypothetical protein
MENIEKQLKKFILRNRIRNAVGLPIYQQEQQRELDKLNDLQKND